MKKLTILLALIITSLAFAAPALANYTQTSQPYSFGPTNCTVSIFTEQTDATHVKEWGRISCTGSQEHLYKTVYTEPFYGGPPWNPDTAGMICDCTPANQNPLDVPPATIDITNNNPWYFEADSEVLYNGTWYNNNVFSPSYYNLNTDTTTLHTTTRSNHYHH